MTTDSTDSSFFPFGGLAPEGSRPASRYVGYELLWEGELTRVGRMRSLDRRWIVKSVIERFRGVPECELRLEKEFKILSSLSHPGIVRCFEFTDIPGLGPSIVMEEVEGVTLSEWLKTPYPLRQRRHVARSLLQAMAYAHSHSVMHLDLKPDNVMVRTAPADRDFPVCILDFGLADTPRSLSLKAVGGTPRYSAPEQLLAGYRATPRADVYSLGILLRMLRPGLSLSLLARRAMSLKPARRPKDAAAMLHTGRRLRLLIRLTLLILLALTALLLTRSLLPTPAKQLPLPAKQSTVPAKESPAPAPQAQPDTTRALQSPVESDKSDESDKLLDESDKPGQTEQPSVPQAKIRADEQAHDRLIAEFAAEAANALTHIRTLTKDVNEDNRLRLWDEAGDYANAMEIRFRQRMKALVDTMSDATLARHDDLWATPLCEPYATIHDSITSLITRTFTPKVRWHPSLRSRY